ncbi:MAG: type II toxin-antitoxin system Phd/YefM family antitoxin [Treponema sp.]|jgi:PHD/YefM family antitoxin component YafN of YafNO toxin-antitoxin module|nr:type II toxin-antitoxin system Phd/YefM family antitoxin [Treponema sp.]
MPVLTVNNVKEKLDILLEEVQDTYEPLIIAGEKHSAVLISEDVWRSIEETLYLSSIPGMKESIINGMNEKIENCTTTIEW